MRWTLYLTPLLIAIGCAPVSHEALCDALAAPVADHASALAVSPDDLAVTTGARVIRGFDAGCGR
jgi:hypothetical protein